jgi:oxalate decarboxylase
MFRPSELVYRTQPKYETIDISQWIAGNPVEILATNVSQPTGVIEQFPRERVFITPQ